MAKKNLTLTLDDELYDKIRVLAASNRTSVSAMVRDYFIDEIEQEMRLAETKAGFRELMDQSTLEFEPETDLKELARSRDPDLLPRHEHSDRSGKDAA